MYSIPYRSIRATVLTICIFTLAACTLPRSGPSRNEILMGGQNYEGDALVIEVTDSVNRVIGSPSHSAFISSLRNSSRLGADTIRPGDKLTLTIWENVDDGIVVARGQNATALTDIQVDEQGFIFVPYAGRIRAAGQSPEGVRRIITEKLSQQTPDPQIQVARAAGDGANVTIIGTAGGQGVFPIERPTRTLGAMLARAGGISQTEEDTRITLIRNGNRGSIFFQDLYAVPGNDVPLRDGDTIVLEKDARSFTSLGATGQQTRVPFTDLQISALDALARVGGLNAKAADPRGIFVFREEPESVVRRLTGRPVNGPQRVIYVLDLTKPNGIFMARDFSIRDEDTLYVSEASFVQVNNVVAAITGSLGNLDKTRNIAQGFGR